MQRRNIYLNIRLTEEEYRELFERAGKEKENWNKTGTRNVSRYCRSLLFAEEAKEKRKNQDLRELVFQVRKIGVNINQAVKRLNSMQIMQGDTVFLLEELERVEELLAEYREMYRKDKGGNDRWQ